MKVIEYLRVSTEEQTRSSVGLDAQRFAITRYAEMTGWDVESGSGTRDNPARTPPNPASPSRWTRSVEATRRRSSWPSSTDCPDPSRTSPECSTRPTNRSGPWSRWTCPSTRPPSPASWSPTSSCRSHQRGSGAESQSEAWPRFLTSASASVLRWRQDLCRSSSSCPSYSSYSS